MNIRLITRALFLARAIFVALTVLWGVSAFSQSIETVMSPGKMSRAHAKYESECNQCHVRFDKQAQDKRCLDCHKETRADFESHTGFHGKMQQQACRVCHAEHRGAEAKLAVLDSKQFDHRVTNFQLLGKHLKIECEKCHTVANKFRGTQKNCSNCHQKDDKHKGKLGSDCATCHVENSWKEARFDHDKTRFGLSGKHVETKCADCHRNDVYKDTPRNCYSCHKKDDDQKGHKGLYGEKCESCHATQAWKTTIFNHDQDTKYSLRGKHRVAKCSACHTSNPYKTKLAQDCISCHSKDDKHKETLGNDCAKCHTEKDWKEPAKFDHAKTDFPLLGRHLRIECKECHEGTMFKLAKKECVACHRKDDKHERTLGDKCGECHTERLWKTTRFEHDATKFPLRNAHAVTSVKCEACHKDLKSMRKTPLECVSCHSKDDKHAGTLGRTCADCHSDRSWKATENRFDHAKTKFPLRNSHMAPNVKCEACHVDVKHFRGTPIECVSCHKKNDKHDGQLGIQCESCHTDVRWKVERYDHNRARFSLAGRHALEPCKSCHLTPRFRDAKRECIGCHLKNDKHEAKLGGNCETCHNARSWALWTFDHDSKTRFKLTGEHIKTTCISCHKQAAPLGKPIAPLSSTCYTCHKSKDPHDGQFGPRCEQCHSTNNWKKIRGQQ
jgi:hypothetical protein